MSRDKNIFCDSLSNYFVQGEKTSKGFGIEVEYFLLTNNNKFVDYFGTFTSGAISIKKIFDMLVDQGLEPKYSQDYPDYVVGLKGDGYDVSLEAGSQFEISFDVQFSISDFIENYNKTLNWLSEKLAILNVRFVKCGSNPAAFSEDIQIYPNKRYEMIYQHLKQFSKNATWGLKSSASCQVSIDYRNESDCGKKLRAGLFLSPIIYFLFDNCKIFETQNITGKTDSRDCIDTNCELRFPLRMPRMLYYKFNDPDRTELSSAVVDSGFSYQKYAEQFYEKSCIFLRDNFQHFDHDGFKLINGLYYTNNTKVKDLLKFADSKSSLSLDEITHLISISWFDVRLRQTIELRCADSSNQKYLFAYLALIEGLFYSDDSLDKLTKLFKSFTYTDYKIAKDELYDKGKEAYVYGKPVFTLTKEIIDIAIGSLSNGQTDDLEYLSPLQNLVEDCKCVVEM